MRYLSLFSGIEAASVAWLPLGWECAAVAEIDPNPCKVLAHHYPNVINLGDITKITQEQIESLGHIDLVVGGFPCQDLSVAGLRKGLKNADGSATRSGLFYTALQIARWSNARWLLLENVPGIYSSNNGHDFASMVGEILNTEFAVPKNGWQNSGVACSQSGLLEWCTLDAQYFGVPQRRRRVFALADFGDWANRQPVLFERDSLQGHSAPSRGERQEVTEIAGTLTSNGGGLNRPAGNANELDFCIATTCSGKETFGTLMANCGTKQWLGNQEALSGDYHVFALAGKTIGRQPENGGNGTGYDDSGVSYTLTKTDQHAVAFHHQASSSQSMNPSEISPTLDKSKSPAVAFKIRGGCEGGGKGFLGSDAAAFTVSTGQDQHLFTNMQVRRLLPIECERLQGFPEITKEVKITVCSDPQNNYANAETQNHKLPKHAGNAEKSASKENASFATLNLNANNLKDFKLAELSAHIDLEQLTLQIHNQEKLVLSVNLAEMKSSFRQLTQVENIARSLVLVLKELEPKAINGKVESQHNINPSFPHRNGSAYVELSGQEIEKLANDAEAFTTKASDYLKSITLEAGQDSQVYEQSLKTLCCFVTAAINTFIQEVIPAKSSFELNLKVSHGYTNVAGLSDSARYKALGNSMAVPCMFWLGERIEMVEALQINMKVAA